MFFFFIFCFSFILLSNSFLSTPVSTWEKEMKLSQPSWFLGVLSQFVMPWFRNMVYIRAMITPCLRFKHQASISFLQVPIGKPLVNRTAVPTVKNVGEKQEISLLDLPDLALDCILERLSPAGLCSMAAVGSSLREMCTSDHLWERHMKQKWIKVIGVAAFQEGQRHIASTKRSNKLECRKTKGLVGHLSSVWPVLWTSKSELDCNCEQRGSVPFDSIMSWYLSVESGKSWFPAQVYNREVQNGLIGFLMSCYDAEVSYNSSSDTFRARYYSAHENQTIEENIEWNRLRPPAVNTAASVLHVSDCLKDLKPGDHIEVQWRRTKEFNYGWWYGVVGHLESCDGNEFHCQCHSSETVILEFKQYNPLSRWRHKMINREEHREVGNEVDGFYGGIRKLYDEVEISTWKRLWPNQPIE